jgi:ADP-heptose:LPS heptosyltransferase
MSGSQHKILVVRQDRLGDAINAAPVLMALRAKFPESKVSFMVAKPLAELFAGQPYADEVISWEPGFFTLIRILRQGRFTHLLMLHPSKALAWAAQLAGVRQKAGLGFKPYYPLTGFSISHPGRESSAPPGFDTAYAKSTLGGVYRDSGHDGHESRYNLAVARSLFDLPEEVQAPRIYLNEEEKAEGRNVLASMNVNNPIAVLPANRGSSANWPPERWGELVRKLVEANQEVLILGGPGEEEILKKVKGETNVPIAGPQLTLQRLAAVLANCRQVIGSSTGTLHLAAAAGARTVGLFCPAPASRPERWRPLGEGHVQLVPAFEFCDHCRPSAKCDLNGIKVEEVLKITNK